MDTDLERTVRERDLYRQLLELGGEQAPEAFLEKALSLFIETAGARRGYIELRDLGAPGNEPVLSMVRGLDPEELAVDGFSRQVIAETFATGEVVLTASALLDPRFHDSGSVRARRLEAVLCAPIGASPVLGVVYLQDRVTPGPFGSDDRARAELFARHVAGLAERLLARRRALVARDPTQEFRRGRLFDGIVGTSEVLAQLLQQVAVVAPLQVGILLTGASGTGKTQLARAVHDNSSRAGEAFIELNCATLQEGLVESELFGAAPGAHSTAQRRIEGKLKAAEGGSLFLDEVSELPWAAQAKLLQFLQSGLYFPLGDASPRRANVRVLAATNADLSRAVTDKLFREDLYYRLNVFPLRVPSLTERRQDIAPLAIRFVKVAAESNGLAPLELSAGALVALEHFEWPGNIRELKHTVEAGVIRAHGEAASRIERRHLFPAAEPRSGAGPDATFQEATRDFQRDFLKRALEREHWNIAATARRLDLTRTHVYNLISTLALERPGGKARGQES